MMRPAKIALVVAGVLLLLLGIGGTVAGGALLWAHGTQRDAAGFYNTPYDQLQTTGYALTAHVDLGARRGDWVPSRPLGTVRVEATSVDRPLFVGIARQADVDRWLAGVAHTSVHSLHAGPVQRDTEFVPGDRSAGVPGAERFWIASTSGTGTQTVVWPSERGRWAAVVMNADGQAGVTADVRVGARTGALLPIGAGIAGLGFLVLAGGVIVLVLGLRQPGKEGGAGAAQEVPAPGTAAPAPVAAGAYPVRLEGHLDPSTSRWLWLVKWILVIPHAFVLAFLWLAVAVLTVVAGFAILFTGRYPRSIFDFTSGVFRWTWRVSFYAVGAFGTDRYPPFSLAPDPSYPADLTIDYPEHLSRGLVLVKWWLLALPHYLIVAVFAGGWGAWWPGSSRSAGGAGLITLLAVIAAVILAVRGRYPESIFDLVMGMNRWCFRVLAYSALMRDEYPPFRLDMGGDDPGDVPAVPPPAAGPDRSGELVATG